MTRPSSGAKGGWSVGPAIFDADAFVHDRVRLYCKILFYFFLFFLLIGGAKILLLPVPDDLRGGMQAAFMVVLSVTVFLGLAWQALRRARRAHLTVHLIETVGTVLTCVGLANVVVAVPGEAIRASGFAPEVGVLLIALLVLVIRAAIVPSSAIRTFAVGAVATAAISGHSLLRTAATPVSGGGDYAQLLWASVMLFGLLFTVATVIISRVIYRLQEHVRAATRLGNYTLEARLGEGGMGVVYLARHALLKRPTAVKVLPPDRAGERMVARFEREVLEAARLSHPGIVDVYDFGRTPDGLFYYAMEYIEGLDFEQLVRDYGAQPAARVRHLMAQVAHALAYAHDQGLVHRDIKPANIVLCNRGGLHDVAKVVDFGLVKDVEGPGDDAGVTAANTVTGTPAYMAPEGLTDPEGVDGRADLYALGAVAYFLLVGEPVFGGATPVEVFSHHLHSAPEPPSVRASEGIPADLEAVVLRCLAKDRAERYVDGHALHAAVLDCVDAGEWGQERAAAWWARHGDAIREQHSAQRRPLAEETLVVARS